MVLEEKSAILEDVVIVGYGAVKRKDLTGAVSIIKPEEIKNLPALRADQLLQGRVAGADFTSISGEPGAGTTIRIRGSRSINADNEPLYVIDGVIDANDATSVGASVLNTLNMDDIASIEVLKDVSATAIYGSRGANGVILITTKSGKSGKDVFSFRSDIGSQWLPKYLDIMNATEWATMANENTTLNSANVLPYPNAKYLGSGTNWTKEVTRNAVYDNQSFSASGGTPSLTYYTSANYTDQQGIVKSSGMKRYQVRLNLDKKFSNKFKMGTRANYAYTDKDNLKVDIGSNAGWWNSTLALPPIMNAYTDNGDLEDWNPAWYSGGVINSPLALVEMVKDNTRAKSLSLNVYGELQLAKGLALRSSLSYTDYSTQRNVYQPGTLPRREYLAQGGYAYKANTSSTGILNENTLSYQNTWKNKHHLNAVGGVTFQKNTYESFSASGSGYLVDAIEDNSLQSSLNTSQNTIASAWSQKTMVSALARFNYDYDSRYYLTLTGRSDGASNFAEGHKWAFFPVIALRWQIKNEAFMKSVSQVSTMALRLSRGASGNQAINPYASLPQLAVNTNGYIFDGSTIPLAYRQGSIPNDLLTWETSDQTNLGLDLGFLNDRIRLTTDAYVTHTKNLLLTIQIPQQTGYQSRLVNLGKTQNKGLEFTLNTDNVITKDFKWSTYATAAFNRQKVVDLGPLVKVITAVNYTATQYPMYAYQVGLPISSLFGAVYEGTWKSQADITANKDKYVSIANYYQPGRERYKDLDGNGLLDENDMTYLGQTEPKFQGGFGNNFTYKGFEADFFFQYNQGAKMYNDMEFNMGTGTLLTNQFRYMIDRWTPDNPDSDIPMVNSKDHIPNSRFVHDASFVRFKSARIGYNFDLKKQKINGVSVYLAGDNLWLWSKYNGYDPDVSTQGTSSTVRRKDDGAYPHNRTV